MGRGRAPCCDKNKVVKGPWSPAEDLKLVSYIENYGHDNWRALPKHAGLLRCGKSCRLRWINYLRPDLKRGNFTAEEERTIIRLHQSLGNKWSRIAAHLPGRTDNEIKNHWNTYLKKRLSKAESRQDETSVITFCSSSSAPVELSPDDDKIETVSQINLSSLDGNVALTSEMESFKTIIANQVPELQESEAFNKFDLSSNHQSGKLLDSSDINQLEEEFILWDDPKEMEFLMSAFEDPDGILAPQTTQLDPTGTNGSFELPLDSGSAIRDMLYDDVMPASANSVDKEADKVHTVEAPMSEKIINAADEWITDKDIEDMFELLNNEPSIMEMQNKGSDGNHGGPAATGNEDNGMPSVDNFP